MKKKHVLDFFRNDHWRVRLAVLVAYWIFLLALAGLITGSVNKTRLASFFALILGRVPPSTLYVSRPAGSAHGANPHFQPNYDATSRNQPALRVDHFESRRSAE
jgi:hypothetical protein